jgi:hypothetical protein
MKSLKSFVTCAAGLFAVFSAQAQTAFQNLDFESANPVPIVGSQYYPYAVTPASALPGWSGSIDGVPVSLVFLNDYALGTASIDIFGPGWNSVNPGIIDGNYTVMLQAGANPQGGSAGVNASLSQNGTIPANAMSLEFEAWSMIANATLSVSFAGNSLSPVGLSSGVSPSGQSYTLYGADISAYAGQSGQLQFTDVYSGQGLNGIELDDITFSTIPEPSTLALLFMGGMAFGVRSWRKSVKASRQDHKA